MSKMQELVNVLCILIGIPQITLRANAGTNEYYRILKDLQQQMNQSNNNSGDGDGDGGGAGDLSDQAQKQNSQGGSHKTWKEFDKLSESEKKLVENQVDYTLKQTAETVQKQQGKIPAELQRKINELFEIKKPVFNWKAYFRRLIGNSIFVYTKKSLRKLSKRFEDNAGLKIKQKTNILVAIDTSGSLSEKELADFFSEIHHIYRAGAGITILECDAAIHRVYKYNGKFDGKVHGGGGTDFAPVIEYYNERRKEFTTLVFFIDGYASLNNFKVKKSMIWVTLNLTLTKTS